MADKSEHPNLHKIELSVTTPKGERRVMLATGADIANPKSEHDRMMAGFALRGVAEFILRHSDDAVAMALGEAPAVEPRSSVSDGIVGMARRMFDAYCQHANGSTHDGKPIPPWGKLSEAVREHWIAAALAACQHLERVGDWRVADPYPQPPGGRDDSGADVVESRPGR